MLTSAERRKLAKAARELASDFAEERGPYITNSEGWCGCVAGSVVRRAYGYSEQQLLENWRAASEVDFDGLLTEATSQERWDRGAAVFPLLWLADELDAQR